MGDEAKHSPNLVVNSGTEHLAIVGSQLIGTIPSELGTLTELSTLIHCNHREHLDVHVLISPHFHSNS
jgi:hypothetical protein